MKAIKYIFQDTLMVFFVVFVFASLTTVNNTIAQCDPSTIDLCEIGNNNVIQASFHAQIAKTSNGYSITGQDFAPDGINYSTVLTNIPSPKYPMPSGVVPIWGAMGGRTQAVFLATDNKIYTIGEEDLLIDQSKTNGTFWGVSKLELPIGVNVCDVNKWQGAAGSGSDNNNNGGSNATGERDGFLVFSTYTGEAYITGDGAKMIQSGASNIEWTMIKMPDGVSVVNFGVGYRTLLLLGNDGNLYASGPRTYLGDESSPNLSTVTKLSVQPAVSVFGISQVEAGFNSYLVLDGNGTIHVLGQNSEGGLGVGNINEVKSWSKVGLNCSEGVLGNVAYISTLSAHDHHVNSSAILVDGTIRSWGSNNKQSITSGADMLLSCPVKPTGNNKNAVAISNGGHISPYVNTSVQICNIGHNRQGAFGDGNDEEGDYGEYKCRYIPGMPDICGTNEANLALEKTVGNTSPNTGGDIVFTITVTNLGPEASTGSFVRDQLSTAFYYLSDDSNGNYNNITGLWKVGPLNVGESKSLNITVKVIEFGQQTNYAQILVDNEVDLNSVPGNESSNEDDDDYVILNVSPCPITESDTLICTGDSLLVGNNWIFQSGLYLESIATAGGCDSLHKTNVLYVDPAPIPQLDVDCEELEYNLSVDPLTEWIPTWGNGDNAYQTKYYEGDGEVLLTLETAPNCEEQIQIDLPPFAYGDDIPSFEDTTVIEYTTLRIDIGLNPDEWKVQWSPESIVDCATCMIGNIITDESTEVTIYYEHISGCSYESSFFLTIESAPENLYVPNVFSPNGDRNNKEWTFYTTPNITIEESIIYDRWGNVMFRSTDQNPIWDGTVEGVDCTQGVYVYLIKYIDSTLMSRSVSGDLTLVR
jgi:gliding motility-associated-like protein/uncharacterized repeat protein (TIGR01451 family)